MLEVEQVLQGEAAVLRQRLPEVSKLNDPFSRSMLKNGRINVKLGGINTIPDQASVRYLTDPANPTIVMGTPRVFSGSSYD